MNGKQRDVTALETELVRLNMLVRERRLQLARLEKCPNKDCPCRVVWRDHVEKNLAGQVGKVRKHVHGKSARLAKLKAEPKLRVGAGKRRRRLAR